MDDRRLLLFFAFSLSILVGWQMLVPAPQPVDAPLLPTGIESSTSAGLPEVPGDDPVDPEDSAPETLVPEEAAPEPVLEAEREEVTVVDTAAYRAELVNRGGQLRSFVLKQHLDSEEEPLDLVRRRGEGPWPLGLVDSQLDAHPLNDALFVVERQEQDGVIVVSYRYRGVLGAAEKRVTFDDLGHVEVEVEVSGEGGWGLLLGPGVRNQDPEAKETRFSNRKSVLSLAGEIETEKVDKLEGIQVWPGGQAAWVGLEDTHFISVLFPRAGVSEVVLQPVLMEVDDELAIRRLVPFDHEDELSKENRGLPRDGRWILRSQGNRMALEGYFGPKEFEVLEGLGGGLEKTIEWGGILRLVVRPLLVGLKWLHANTVPNYGWAIVLMTFGLKIVLFPLTHKGYVSMQKMQKLQPRMKAIRQKYKSKMRDKRGKMDMEVQRKMNEEMQALFKSEGASPTGGCFPMLLQMPVFFAFFRLLSTAVELRHEPWILWIKDLSGPDPLFVLPVVMGATQIFQQKLTPTAADPMQRKIMQLFPWMFMIFAISFPSGLVLYWTVNNAFTIVQTATYKKWKERKEAEEKVLAKTRKASKAAERKSK